MLHFHFSRHLPGIFKNQKQALVSESIVAGTKLYPLKTVTLHAENSCLPIGFKCDAKGPLQASICKCLGARNLFQYFHDPLHRGTDANGHNVFISGQNGSGAENWLQMASQNPDSKLVHVGFQIMCKPYTVSAPCSYTILKMK